MGRKKINPKDKKKCISIVVSKKNFRLLTENKINKSGLINRLLEQHFGLNTQIVNKKFKNCNLSEK